MAETTEADVFATAAQMEQRSGGFIPASQPFLDLALAAATRKIRNHCRWRIAKVGTETLRLRPSAGSTLQLPTGRLVGISALSVAGTVLEPSELDWYDDGGLDLAGHRGRVEITFEHGYAEVPEDIIDLTLMVAARALGSPLGIVREQTLGASVQWAQTAAGVAGGTTLLAHERDDLDRAYTLGYTP